MLTYSTSVYIYVRLHVDLLDQLPVLSNLQRWLTEIGKPLEHDKKITLFLLPTLSPFPHPKPWCVLPFVPSFIIVVLLCHVLIPTCIFIKRIKTICRNISTSPVQTNPSLGSYSKGKKNNLLGAPNKHYLVFFSYRYHFCRVQYQQEKPVATQRGTPKDLLPIWNISFKTICSKKYVFYYEQSGWYP